MVEPSPQDRYSAFISYSHADRRHAEWLHRSLERYRIPRRLRGQTNRSGVAIPATLFPIFIDREELPGTSDLAGRIKEALANSDHLIVVCSQNTPSSRWIDAEVAYFQSLERSSQITAVRVSNDEDATAIACLPPALVRSFSTVTADIDRDSEPLIVDLAKRHRDEFLRLVAAVLSVNYRDLKRRDFRRSVRTRVSVAAVIVALAFGAWGTLRQIVDLRHQRDAFAPKPPSAAVLADQETMSVLVRRVLRDSRNVSIVSSGYEQGVDLGAAGTYDIAESNLNPAGDQFLRELATAISEDRFRTLAEIQILAHADALPVIRAGAGNSNWQLSAVRAAQIAARMEAFGIDPTRIALTPIAPGQYRPRVGGAAGIGRENRRVELRLLYREPTSGR